MLADDTEVLGSDYVVKPNQTYISSMNVTNECEACAEDECLQMTTNRNELYK